MRFPLSFLLVRSNLRLLKSGNTSAWFVKGDGLCLAAAQGVVSLCTSDSRNKAKAILQRDGQKCKAATTFPKERICLLKL